MWYMKGATKNMKEYYVVKKGFISTTFLIVMCSIAMIITAKSDYIVKANEVYYNLIQYEELFNMEAKIIDYAKCALLRNETLDDFYIDNCLVEVFDYGDEYILYFDNYKMAIEVYNKQIIGMKVEAL